MRLETIGFAFVLGFFLIANLVALPGALLLAKSSKATGDAIADMSAEGGLSLPADASLVAQR